MLKSTKALKIKIGEIIGRLKVIGPKEGNHIWCECSCENKIKKLIAIRYLVNKRTLSCGCIGKEKIQKLNLSHNMCNHKLYKIRAHMIRRCYSEKDKFHKKYYFDKGIKIYQPWLDDFINFYNWAIENGWKKDLTIERKDINGNYCPENCCWILAKDQQKNTSKSVKITAFGETKILADWARDKRCEVHLETFRKRIHMGILPEKAMKKKYENN